MVEDAGTGKEIRLKLEASPFVVHRAIVCRRPRFLETNTSTVSKAQGSCTADNVLRSRLKMILLSISIRQV